MRYKATVNTFMQPGMTLITRLFGRKSYLKFQIKKEKDTFILKSISISQKKEIKIHAGKNQGCLRLQI